MYCFCLWKYGQFKNISFIFYTKYSQHWTLKLFKQSTSKWNNANYLKKKVKKKKGQCVLSLCCMTWNFKNINICNSKPSNAVSNDVWRKIISVYCWKPIFIWAFLQLSKLAWDNFCTEWSSGSSSKCVKFFCYGNQIHFKLIWWKTRRNVTENQLGKLHWYLLFRTRKHTRGGSLNII